MIPTSYKLALTVQEQILAIGKYLEETVIPALNNNAEAVVELQNLYIELKNYVDNYFANLDVQNEINNKIDDLVNDGTFEDMLEPLLENLQNAILNLNNTKRDKNVLITMNDLSQDVKSAMTGGSVAIVGNQSVNNASVQDFSLSPSKMNFVNQINNNLLDMSLVSNTVYNKNGTTSTNGNFVASDFIDVGEVVLNETAFSTNASGGGFVLFDSEKKFIELRGNKSITIDNNKIKYIQLNIYKQDPNYDILYIVKNNLRPIYVNKLNKPSFLKNNNIFVETDNLIGNTIKPDNVTFINHITNNLYNKNLVNKNGYFDLNGYYREIGRNAPLNNYGSEIMNLPNYIKDETVFYQYPCPRNGFIF